MHAFCSDFPEPCLHFVCWNHQGKKADKKGSALQQCRHTRQVALTSASLHVTRAVLCYQGDPVSSCTDLNVTTLSAARPSYFSTWRVAFFKVGGERFGFGLGFSPPPRLFQMLLPMSVPAKMPGEKSLSSVSAHLRPPKLPTSAGRASRQPLLGFLFLIGTHPPEGHHISFITVSHLRDAWDKLTRFSPAFFTLPLPQTEAILLCAVQSVQLPQPLLQLAKNLLQWAVNSSPL